MYEYTYVYMAKISLHNLMQRPATSYTFTLMSLELTKTSVNSKPFKFELTDEGEVDSSKWIEIDKIRIYYEIPQTSL